jgi:hypothetical protein
MASFITAGNATNGLQVSSDNTGILELKSGTGSGTTAVTVNASQNVGIGTSTPTSKLQVVGAVVSSGSSSGYINYDRATNILSNTIYSPIAGQLRVYDNIAATDRTVLDENGNFLLISAAGLGYGTGSGGTVTQATSKATAVTLNKPTGRITMNGAALAANTNVQFVVNNSLVSASDVVLLTMNDANGPNYQVQAYVYGAGTFTINLRNITGGSLSNALVLNFAVIKGATS